MYLEEDALEEKDGGPLPFTGEKKGRIFVPKEKPLETRKEEKVTPIQNWKKLWPGPLILNSTTQLAQ